MVNEGTDLYPFIVKDFLFFYCHTNDALEIEFNAQFRPHAFHSWWITLPLHDLLSRDSESCICFYFKHLTCDEGSYSAPGETHH